MQSAMSANIKPLNIAIYEAAQKIVKAVEALTENGFMVVRVEMAAPARPTIRIQSCSKCQTLIDKGEAVYFSFGQGTHFGPYREGQFHLGGCRIVWTEFGN